MRLSGTAEFGTTPPRRVRFHRLRYRIAIYGTAAGFVAAFLVNLNAWGGNCGRISRALQAGYVLSGQDVAFFDLFAGAPPGFEEQGLAVVQGRLQQGAPAQPACGPLAARFDMTRQAVTQHLGRLEDANLVATIRRGREKLHYLNPVPIHEIYERWIVKYERQRLDALHAIKKRAEGDHHG